MSLNYFILLIIFVFKQKQYSVYLNKNIFGQGRTIYLGIDEHFCQDGFLVNGMQGLGVFVNTEGVSSRPPIFWGTNTILSFTYRSPYIFVLTATWISIYGWFFDVQKKKSRKDGSSRANNFFKIYFFILSCSLYILLCRMNYVVFFF